MLQVGRRNGCAANEEEFKYGRTSTLTARRHSPEKLTFQESQLLMCTTLHPPPYQTSAPTQTTNYH